MVEELKLAIKVDDDAIEQALIKQFANAEKMANKVVLTFNNIDLDDKAIEAKFKEMQKMAGKNPIDLSIDKSSIEMLSAISKQLGNIFDIAKGKSLIDSSATVSEINKITQATKELNKAQTGSENIQSKSFTTKNKTEAYNQLKQTADVFKQFYGNEEAMHTKAGTEAAYAYYKAYEEALKKGVAQSRLESVTVDVDTDSFYNANKLSYNRIKDFESFKKYGEDITELSAEILYLEGKLLDFADAYTKVKANLGDAPITPDIIRNIEYYVKLLDKARRLESFSFVDDDDKDIVSRYRDSSQFWLDNALFKAKIQNEEYTASLKEVREEKEKTDEVIMHYPTSTVDDSKFDELKADVTEISEELNGVKEKISAIDSEGFEHVKADVEKTVESVKELNSELTEVKSQLDNTSSVETNISSENSIVESQNKIQEELKETQKQAEETSKAILKVTAYRGTNGGDPVTSNKSGATFWDSKKNVANMYGTNSNDKTLWSSELSFNNPLVIDAKKQKYGDISYLGDGADKASEAILELTKRENQLRESLEKSTKSGLEEVAMVYELQDVCRQIKKISDDTSNPYGTHSSDWFAEYAKNNGYDGLHIKNVLDTPDSYAKNGTEVSDVFVTFQREQLENTVLLAKANKDLAESEREVALAELGVVKNTKTPIEDVFQGGTTSAEKLEEEIKNIDSATEKASESAKEYGKILSQVGFVGKQFDDDGNQIPSKYSYTRQTGENQIQTITVKYEQDKESGEIVEKEIIGDYITGFQALEKEIDKADKKVFDLKKTLESNKVKLGDNYDSSALETLISNAENEANMLYDTLLKVYDAESEYEYSIAQYADERAKKQSEYNTQLQNAKNIDDARAKNASDKKNESNEKKRLANIEQVNRALNKQQITIDAIEKTYNKTTNPDLDREVSNQQDLAELAQKKLSIQTKINSLQGQERNSANEKEFLELEKLIAEYKELAKYKLKANNPSKQELGGQNLQTLIQVQISNYNKLITKVEKYGDATSDTIEKLKEQRDILSKMGSDGKYSATADQYYASRDTYKVESAALSAFEAETRAIEQKRQAVKKLSDELKSYNNQIPKKPVDGKRSDYFEDFVKNYKNAIDKAQEYLDNLGDSPVTEKVKNKWKELTEVIEKAKKEMDAVPTAERGSDALSRGKEIDTITKYLNKFTGISKQAKRELNGLLDQLQSGDPSVNVKKIHERFLELTVAERNAGREARNLFDIFKDKKIYSFLGQAASMFSFYDLIRYGREGIDTLKEFDDGLTKISYTMDMTKSQLNDLGKSVLEMANDLDSSINNAMQVSQIYANMNTSAEEIKKLSEPTLILSNLTGFNASTVADDIQAVTQQFDIAAESSMHIADVYDQISRNISVDYSKGIESIAEAVQVAGSTADQAGLSFEQLAAIVGKTVEKTRLEGSQVGNGLKTIMTRLSKVGELSEEVDNETLSQASESLKKVGIEVYNLDGSYREFDVIMGELAGKWDNLTDAEKSNISFNIAATRQTNLLSAVLSNFSDSMQLAEEATNANGNALENNQKWVDSFGGHLQSLENTAKSAWINILDSETIKGGVDVLNSLLKVVVGLVDTFGLLPTAAGIGGIVAGFKNVGQAKMWACLIYAYPC